MDIEKQPDPGIYGPAYTQFVTWLRSPPPLTGPAVYDRLNALADELRNERDEIRADRAILYAAAWHMAEGKPFPPELVRVLKEYGRAVKQRAGIADIRRRA